MLWMFNSVSLLYNMLGHLFNLFLVVYSNLVWCYVCVDCVSCINSLLSVDSPDFGSILKRSCFTRPKIVPFLSCFDALLYGVFYRFKNCPAHTQRYIIYLKLMHESLLSRLVQLLCLNSATYLQKMGR